MSGYPYHHQSHYLFYQKSELVVTFSHCQNQRFYLFTIRALSNFYLLLEPSFEYHPDNVEWKCEKLSQYFCFCIESITTIIYSIWIDKGSALMQINVIMIRQHMKSASEIWGPKCLFNHVFTCRSNRQIARDED